MHRIRRFIILQVIEYGSRDLESFMEVMWKDRDNANEVVSIAKQVGSYILAFDSHIADAGD